MKVGEVTMCLTLHLNDWLEFLFRLTWNSYALLFVSYSKVIFLLAITNKDNKEKINDRSKEEY